jgi:hypothetical protein
LIEDLRILLFLVLFFFLVLFVIVNSSLGFVFGGKQSSSLCNLRLKIGLEFLERVFKSTLQTNICQVNGFVNFHANSL